jgi:hypothetical protein
MPRISTGSLGTPPPIPFAPAAIKSQSHGRANHPGNPEAMPNMRRDGSTSASACDWRQRSAHPED